MHEVLDASAVPPDAPPVRAGAVTVSARHAGLVLGLALIAPVLSTSLVAGIERATLGATQTMLLTDLPLSDKIPVTWALREAIDEAPRGQVPDLAAEFDDRGAEGDNAMAQARDDLMDTVTDAVTRSFRPAFAIAAVLAALAALPAAVVARRRPASRCGRLGPPAHVVDGRHRRGRRGRPRCSSRPSRQRAPTPASSSPRTPAPQSPTSSPVTGSTHRSSASPCPPSTARPASLGTTRERLVLSLDPNSSFDDVTWDRDTMEEALRNGAHRAIDDANDRDAIPGLVAAALGFVVDRAPVDWLVERLPIPGG